MKYQLGIVPFRQTFYIIPGRILAVPFAAHPASHPAKQGLLLDGPTEAAPCRDGPGGGPAGRRGKEGKAHKVKMRTSHKYLMIGTVTEKFHSSILIKQRVLPRAVDGRLTHV